MADQDSPPSIDGEYDAASQRWASTAPVSVGNNRENKSRLEPSGVRRSIEKKVLVITQKFDPHTDIVINELEKIGVDALRINTEDILASNAVLWTSDDYGLVTLRDFYGRTAALPGGVVSCYLRTPLPVLGHPQLCDESAITFAASEGESFVENLYALSDLKWISPPHLLRAATPKIPQLQLARKLGLQIPRTLVTNDPKEALRFARSLTADLAVKPLMTPSVVSGNQLYNLYTRRMSIAKFASLADSIQYAPCVLQEYIPKASEYRVTIIGSDLFATELDTQSVPGAETDWREVDASSISHRPVELPMPLQEVLRSFIRHYRLEFGAIDLLRTSDGEFVFLENNPNGVWHWLELETGMPMVASMARLLTQSGDALRSR